MDNKPKTSITTILLTCTAIAMTVVITNMALAQSSNTSSASSSVKIQAGGGNSTIPYTVYNPATAQIKSGQTVMWYNPSVAPEPHTVTFALDNNTRPELSAPFAV